MKTMLIKGMPQAWHERLKEMAAEHRRSVNQELLTLLGTFLGKHEVSAPKKVFKPRIPITEKFLAEAKREGRG